MLVIGEGRERETARERERCIYTSAHMNRENINREREKARNKDGRPHET